MNKKDLAFIFWFCVLWGILSWALIEYTFPRGSYMPNWLLTMLALGLSILLLVGLGRPLYSYLREKEDRRRGTRLLFAAFLTATLVLTSWLAPSVSVSAENKSKVQWYIDDLKSQGFRVEYHSQYPYNRGGVSHVDSYSDFTSLAKELNCTYVLVYGGAPIFFIFFFPSEMHFLINEHSQYLLCIYW